VEYQHPDRLGTRLVTNNQDTTSFEQAALPFGTALDAESTGATKRRFTSYDRSSVTGLDYAVNRHYDPLQGRFSQVDPIGMGSTSLVDPQSFNLYAYCGNDPVNHLDPSGLGFFSFLKKVFGFFAKIAKWVAVVVAVAVLVAVAFPAFAPILGTILFNTGIWQLGAGVSASFLTGGVAAAGISLGATGLVIGGLAAAGAVNSFMAKKRAKRPRKKQGTSADLRLWAQWLGAMSMPVIAENNLSDASNEVVLCQGFQETGLGIHLPGPGSRFKGWLFVGSDEARGVGFSDAEIGRMNEDPALGVRAGTKYLGSLMKRARGDVRKALSNYRGGAKYGGPSYADKIIKCADTVKGGNIGGGLLGLHH